jgi:NAD(P)H-dependent flavin oxidoreductase YrpB (nitropropane dioxygenase family)
MKKDLTEILGIQYPIIMAPMFLVSNVEMVIAATKIWHYRSNSCPQLQNG